MKWWLNGSEAEHISASDRGLAYGDGLFETMRAVDFEIPLINRHFDRLALGAERLGLRVSEASIDQSVSDALAWVKGRNWPQALIKLILTRSGGETNRGYRPDPGAPANIMVRASEIEVPNTAALLQTKITTKICEYRLPAQSALAGIKHLNRLDQVLASRELGTDEDEGLLLDAEGYLAEGISHNVFLVHGSRLSTPLMRKEGVKGVMRDFLIEQIANMPSISIEERNILPEEIPEADEILLTNAVRGVRNVSNVKELWSGSDKSVGDRLRELLCERLTPGFHSF